MSTVHNFRHSGYYENPADDPICTMNFSKNRLGVWILLQMNEGDPSNVLQTDN